MKLNPSRQELEAAAVELDSQGRTEEAIAAYQRLLDSWPGLPNSWFNLAVLQRKSGQFPAALKSYQEALERNVQTPEEVHVNRGVIFSDGLDQYDAAERELKKALALNSDYAPALINLGNLYEDLGRRELAASAYERLLALAPESPYVLARYAALIDFTSVEDPMIGRLRHALTQPGINTADRANVEFALGRALDACEAYDAAFDAYRAANRHSRESVAPGVGNYDLAAMERYVDALIAAFPAARSPTDLAPPLTPASVPTHPTSQPQPIFMCGMFRSGSTLLEQLLAGHPRVTSGGELDYLPNAVQANLAPFPQSLASISSDTLQAIAAGYLAMLNEQFRGAEQVIDKRLDNFLNIGLIKTLFPAAKIVHTTRDALDNCLSIYFLHLDQSMSYALDIMDIGHFYRQYLRIMTHWKSQYGQDILDVSYDALVREPKPLMDGVLRFLDLSWDDKCLAPPLVGRRVKTASVWQVRQPLYLRSSGRARHYARQLRHLREYLDHL